MENQVTISLARLKQITSNPPDRIIYMGGRDNLLAVPFVMFSSIQSRAARYGITLPEVVRKMEDGGFQIPFTWYIQDEQRKSLLRALTEYKAAHVMLGNLGRYTAEAA